MMPTYENNHTGRTITGEFNRFAFDAVHDPAYHDLYRTACDKLTAKHYVADEVGEQYVASLLAVGDSPEEVMSQVSIKDYIVKYNLNSGINGFVRNKKLGDLRQVPTGPCWYFIEDPKQERGRFFAEPILSEHMHTYKFFFHEGRPLAVYYYYENQKDDSTSIRTTVSMPDLKPLGWVDRYKSKGVFRKSKNWEEIVWLAKTLAAPFPVVRMDIFDADDRVYFSEFTATFRAFDMSEESGKYLMEKIRCH